MMTSTSLSAPRTLQVFKHTPTKEQVDAVVCKYVLGKKVEATPFIYSEKPQIHVVPIHMAPDILIN